MPHESRASDNSLTPSRIRSGEVSEVVCAAGQASSFSNRGHAGDLRLKKPMAPEDREALTNLCRNEKMIRRGDGQGYGTETQTLATSIVAARLKARGFAVSSFDQRTMYPSDKGKRLFAEMKNASSS